MDPRSSWDDIAIISEQLKIFTLRELTFVLQFNEELTILDKNRFRRIKDCLQFRFGGQQTLEQVRTAIHLLRDTYSQTLPMQRQCSLISLSHRCLTEPIITPFSSVCFTCSYSLNTSHAKQRQIKIYHLNGGVSAGIVYAIFNWLLSNSSVFHFRCPYHVDLYASGKCATLYERLYYNMSKFYTLQSGTFV